MEQAPKKRLSELLHADLLPPPPMGRALAFGGVAALLGTTAWGLLLFYGNVEHGVLAWAIGGLIGFAVVKGGGYGTQLATAAGILAVLAIATGKNLGFRLYTDQWVEQVCTPEMHAETKKDAGDWQTLGADPTDTQVREFATSHDYEFSTAETFRDYPGEMLTWFAANEPTLEQWQEWERADGSFLEYLMLDFHPLDIVFLVLGIATAAGLVRKRTTELRDAALQTARAERDAEDAAAETAESQ